MTALIWGVSFFKASASGSLDKGLFPYLRDSPSTSPTGQALGQRPALSPQPTSLRSAKPNWHRAQRPGAGAVHASDLRERLLVFVAGGMTYSEIKTAYQRSAALNKDIFVGEHGTSIEVHGG